MLGTWKDVHNAYFALSEEGQQKVRDAAIACILHLPERCSEPRIFNTRCPEPMCESMLPILETDSEEKICTCGNNYVWVAWREETPVVGLVRPVTR